jgi:hypothetical protein
MFKYLTSAGFFLALACGVALGQSTAKVDRNGKPPPTDAQVIAGTILGIANMAIGASIYRRHW